MLSVKAGTAVHNHRSAVACALGGLALGGALYGRQRLLVNHNQTPPAAPLALPPPPLEPQPLEPQPDPEVARLQMAVATRPGDVAGHYALAQRFLKLSQLPAGAAELQQVLRLQPSHQAA